MSSTTTQKTEIPDPSPEEQAMVGMMTDALMPAYMEEAGYEVTKSTTTWADSAEAKSFSEQKASLQKQIDAAKQASSPYNVSGGNMQAWQQQNSLQQKLYQLEEEERKAQEEYKPEVNYETRKKADLATEQIRSQYGADSPEYKKALGEYEAKQIDTEQQTERITKMAMDKAEKFLKGDYSLTPEQDKYVTDLLGPIKEAGLNAVKYLKDEAATSEKGIQGAIDSFAAQVKETGMKMGDAIVEFEDRVKTTGANMKTALEESISTTKAMVEMGIEDFSLDTRKSLASQAARLGRSVTDPVFVKEMTDQVNKEVQRTGLAFAQMSAEQRMGIEERTGGQLEQASLAKEAIAERTGAGLEQAAQATIGLKERTAGLNEQAALMKGQSEVGLAEAAANLRKDIGMGQVPGTVGLGLNINQYQQGVQQQNLANAGAAYQAPASMVSYMQSERMAEPTKTTTTSPGIGSILGGILGTGLDVAGAAAGGSFGSAVSDWFK